MATRVGAAGVDGNDSSKISDKIKHWAYLGGKYDALCRDIGNYNVAEDYKYLGNLIRLPEDMTDRFIRKELKVKGPDRKKEIDSLMRRGVYQSNKENDDIDCLADTIFRHMWDQIEPYIPPDDIQHETAFYSLKDWRKLHGTRVLRLQNGDCRTQVVDEEEHHIGAKGNELAAWNQNANARATDRCVALSPSAQDEEDGRIDLRPTSSSGPSSSRDTSDVARSDFSDSPGSTSQGIILRCGDTPMGNTLIERDSAEEILPGAASTSPHLPECPSNLAHEGQQSERLLAQSTFTGVEEEEGISGTGSSAPGISPTGTDYPQWANEVVGSIPFRPEIDSGPSSLRVFDAILHRETQDTSITRHKRRRTQTTQDIPAIQFRSNSFARDTFNPRQYGQPAMSLDDPAAQGTLVMQFGSNPFAPHDTFNPKQHGQPIVSVNGPGAQDAIGTQLYSSQMPHDAFGAHNAFNPRHYGQPMVSLNEPTEQGMYNVQNLVNVDFGLVEVQS
ncbi:hypothetical protein PMG11_01928 [Penicillium brasilianum]|uniref:Uncharacterized protein n=1 Tax=Penicillium brasilianum TaxID=104259 RepID=A0A0F7TIG3_PENBI|nr:hypothetical protein PMG11_01928 [Penicillium brasilianum]